MKKNIEFADLLAALDDPSLKWKYETAAVKIGQEHTTFHNWSAGMWKVQLVERSMMHKKKNVEIFNSGQAINIYYDDSYTNIKPNFFQKIKLKNRLKKIQNGQK